jgi:hypothetical protein
MKLKTLLWLCFCVSLSRSWTYELGTNPGATVCFHELALPHHVMTYSYSPFLFRTVSEFMKLPQTQNSGLIEAYQKVLEDRKTKKQDKNWAKGSTKRKSQGAGQKSNLKSEANSKIKMNPPGGRGRVLQQVPNQTQKNSKLPGSKSSSSNSSAKRGGIPSKQSKGSTPRKASKEYYSGESDQTEDPENRAELEAANEQWKKLEAELEAGHKSRGQGKPLGRLTVVNKEGELLARNPEPYKLYRLSEFKLPDEISLCFTNETEGVVFLIVNINAHHVVHHSEVIPNRDETDMMLNKIRKLERDLQEFQDNYKELEKFEERHIGMSSSVLTSLTIIGQLLLLVIFIVSFGLRVLMDKTFKYRKVV